VESDSAQRIWRVCKEAGREVPKFSEDDVIDYMVLEAVALKVWKQQEEASKKKEKSDWKNDKEALKKKVKGEKAQ
jgi:hypothetical protein